MTKYALWVKCLTFVLCVLLALCVAVSGLGILMAENLGMYTQDDYREWMYDRYQDMADTIARQVVLDYAASLSNCPQWLLHQTEYAEAVENVENWFALTPSTWCYSIQKNDTVLHTTYTDSFEKDVLHFIFEKVCKYPMIGEDADYIEVFRNSETGESVRVFYQEDSGYQVDVWISESYTSTYMNNGLSPRMMQWLFAAKIPLVVIAAVSLVLFVVAFIFLLLLAGKDKTGVIDPKAWNRMPLDLYLVIAVVITYVGCWCAYELLDRLFYRDSYNVLLTISLCIFGAAVATADLGFFAAVAAQSKLRNHYWYTNSICGRLLRWIWKGLKLIRKGIRKILNVLPLVWEWLLIGAGLGIGMLLACLTAFEFGSGFPVVVWSLIGIATIGYGGWCYGTIRKGIQRMNQGDLNEKIDTKWMYGSFKMIAEELNVLADAVMIAAEKQLKAERMKTELITNVSHDIKTPLTSVINYVDLLQQPHTEAEGTQYLEVLSRQSSRLKKLVDDLMDMSKASSGNMMVNITSMDMVEVVNQALGEFADKLDMAELTPVFRPQMPQMKVYADGRLIWRVLSNLLGNVVKYALPGTRVYLDLLQQDSKMILSLKNISREELNISAEELTERFVRGDTSRNTEGSGLGLNIAQSLMHLQKGDLKLTVDGDLFKVTLTFPVS